MNQLILRQENLIQGLHGQEVKLFSFTIQIQNQMRLILILNGHLAFRKTLGKFENFKSISLNSSISPITDKNRQLMVI